MFAKAEVLPKLNFENVTLMRKTFNSMLITTIDYYINSGKATDFARCFANCKNLKSIVGIDTSNATTVQLMFSGCAALETIQMPLNFQYVTNTSNAFQDSKTSLKNISFVPETIKVSITIPSPVLSKESISGKEGIINGLNSEVTGQTLTLSLKAVKKAFETSEGANDGDTSAAWSELVASKPNWTITLL
jgi:hypothetical protein